MKKVFLFWKVGLSLDFLRSKFESAKPLVESVEQASPKEIHETLSITMRLMYGCLVYRPEINYQVSIVARFAKNPDKTHKEYL